MPRAGYTYLTLLLTWRVAAAAAGAGTLPPPTMVPEVDPSGQQPPYDLTVVGDSILFGGPAPVDRYQIWQLLGGAATPVALACGDQPSVPGNFVQLPNSIVGLLVDECDSVPDPFLASLDATSGTVSTVTSTDPPLPEFAKGLSRLEDRAYLSYANGTLWSTDGTNEGTSLVYDFVPPPMVPDPDWRATVTSMGPWGLLSVPDGIYSRPWRTDGTSAGTVQLSSTVSVQTIPLADGTRTPAFVPLGERALFAGWTPADGEELWSTDGTAGGTFQLGSLRPGNLGIGLAHFFVCGDTAYFGAVSVVPGGDTRLAIWRSDGTVAGTYPIGELEDDWIGLEGWPIGCLGTSVVIHQLVYPEGDRFLSVTDGTYAGTQILMEISGGFETRRPGVEYQGWLFFAAAHWDDRFEVWATNGTPAGTFKTADIAPGLADSDPHNLTPFGDSLYFIADDQVHGPEIWRIVVDPTLIFRDGFDSAVLTAWSQPAE